jgi:drug/metabolite transporter (DMT)-like permease
VTLALPFLLIVATLTGQQPRWPKRALLITVLTATIFYALDLASWNAGIRLTKLGNATLFGNSGSFVFVIYGLWLSRKLPTTRQGTALALAIGGAALLMSSSYELSPRNLDGDLLTLVGGLLYGGYLICIERARNELKPMPLLLLVSLFAITPLLFISLAGGERIWPHDWTPLLIFALSSQVLGQGFSSIRSAPCRRWSSVLRYSPSRRSRRPSAGLPIASGCLWPT